jgi:hypothetical protein
MGALAKLPTLAEVQADRTGPLWKTPTGRLDAADAKEKDDAKLLEQWRRQVKTRDRGRCRVCGVKTIATMELDPKRGEAHHIVSRADKSVRYDVRNGLHVCLRDHRRFKGHRLHVVGTAAQMFVAANGKSYLDASWPLTFKETR